MKLILYPMSIQSLINSVFFYSRLLFLNWKRLGCLILGISVGINAFAQKKNKVNNKPHVVIIMADQLRYDAIGPHTPHINQLIQEGVQFTRSYCASPICVPSRGSFFTGKYPNETGSILNPWEPKDSKHGLVNSGISNLYQLLEKDWDSWHTGKQHFLTVDKIDEQPESKTKWLSVEEGYDKYLKENGKRKPGGSNFKDDVPEMASGKITRIKSYSIPTIGVYEPGFDFFYDGYILKQSLKALRNRDKSKPLLLNAMHLAPLPPLDVPEPWYSMVKNPKIPQNVGKWSTDQSPLQLYNLTGVLGNRYSREQWSQIWPVYLGLVGLLDYCVGETVKELKAQGMYDNTLIVFTADHGEMLGSHNLWQKMCMYEESSRVPLILKFPKSYTPHTKTSDQLVNNIDVFPTLCQYLGVSPSNPVSGLSLMPVVEGKKLSRDRIFIQFDGNGARGNFQRCVVEGDYKLIVDMFKDELFLELYNLRNDPQELVNLSFEEIHHERIQALLTHLRKHMQQTGDLLTVPDDAYANFIAAYAPFRRNKP